MGAHSARNTCMQNDSGGRDNGHDASEGIMILTHGWVGPGASRRERGGGIPMRQRTDCCLITFSMRIKEEKEMLVTYLSGDPEYISGQLQNYMEEGWEIISIATNIYQSTSGIRTETTAYLKKNT